MKNLYHSDLTRERFDAIVIGSGLGGLTAAVLLAKSKKKVLVLEKHYVPGGFTHTFRRKNFSWDVGVHYVGQVNQENALMKKVFDYVSEGQLEWASMGETYDKAIIEGDEYAFVCGEENQINELLKHFPEEETAIRKYFSLIRRMGASTGMFFGERTMPPLLSRTLGYFLRRGFYKYSDRTTYDVLRSLTSNEKLISVLCAQCGNYGLTPKKSSFAMQAIIAEHYLHGGSYPCGGAASIHKKILDVLEKHQGVLALKAEVDHIIIREEKAVGVVLRNGDELLAPLIISNAGARNTYQKLLPATTKLPPGLHHDLDQIQASTAHICLYIGLNRSDEELNLPKWNYWIYRNYHFDEELARHLQDPSSEPPLAYISFPSAKDPEWPAAKPGTSTIQVIAAASYEWVKQWEATQWQKRGEAYEEFKADFKHRMLEKLFQVVPQARGCVTVCEVSTPLSTKHFSNYQEGEIYGLEHTPARFRLKWLRARTPVKNLFLTGQDLTIVGVGGALFSGLLTASSILNKNFMWHALRYKTKP